MKTKVSDSGGVLLDFQQLDQDDRHRQRHHLLTQILQVEFRWTFNNSAELIRVSV